MHSIPFGSSVLCTKQLNASRNSSPQGPCAIPPRQGQSQLISPVSGLKAPSWPASASRSPSEPPWTSPSSSPSVTCSVAGAAATLPSDSADASDVGAAAAAAALAFALSSAARAAARARFSATMASIVGSSVCWMWWILSSNLSMAAVHQLAHDP